MKVEQQPFVPSSDFPKGMAGFLQYLKQWQIKLRQYIDGAGLGFGDGVNNDNIYGSWISYTSNAVANTEDVVNHNIGAIPVGFLVMSADKAASVYKGTTAWSSTQISLKVSVASVNLLIFVVGPSNQAY